MEKSKKYLKEIQSAFPYMGDSLNVKDIINYRKKQLNISNNYVERYVGKNSIELFEEFYYKIIIRPFLRSLPQKVSDKLKNVYVGLLPTFKMNAMAIKTPENDFLIAINSQLFTAISQFNEGQFIAGKQLIEQENGKIEGKGIEELRKIYKQIINCYRFPNLAPRMSLLEPSLTYKELEVAYEKTLFQELYIIAHEFAHIYLGHLDVVKEIKVNERLDPIEVYVRNQQMELEADLQAFQWLLDASKRKEMKKTFVYFNDFPSIALELFLILHMLEVNTNERYKDILYTPQLEFNQEYYLRFIEVISEASLLSTEGKISSMTNHPLAIIRFAHVFANIKENISEKDSDFCLGMLKDMCAYETFKIE